LNKEFSRGKGSKNPAKNVTVTGAIINALLAAMKFTAGWHFHSRALMADAVDSTTDLVTDGITLIAYPLSRKPVDIDHPYGHGRMESLAAMLVSGVLMFAAGLIAYQAIHTLMRGEIVVPAWPALIFAVISLIVKEYMFRWTMKVAKKLNSRVLVANAWNHRGDAFSSIAVFIGIAGAIMIPGAKSLDAWASLVVVLFIFRAGFSIARNSANDLLDKAQDPEMVEKVGMLAGTINGVLNAHRIRSRRYGPLTFIDLDIEVDPGMKVVEAHELAHSVQKLILTSFEHVADVLIHVEPEGDHLKGEGPIRIN